MPKEKLTLAESRFGTAILAKKTTRIFQTQIFPQISPKNTVTKSTTQVQQ